jgi:hypothetical protein
MDRGPRRHSMEVLDDGDNLRVIPSSPMVLPQILTICYTSTMSTSR